MKIGHLEGALADYTQAIQRIEARKNPDEAALLAKLFWNRG